MKDLTVGRPSRVLVAYSLPLFGSIIFQQLYNIADSLVAGRYIGTEALAAVGNSYEITLIYIALAVGCNIGASVITARFFGEKRWSEVRSAITTSLIFSAALERYAAGVPGHYPGASDVCGRACAVPVRAQGHEENFPSNTVFT